MTALFNLGDLASPLFESELRSVILFGSNPVASSLSYSDSVRSPILNRAYGPHGSRPGCMQHPGCHLSHGLGVRIGRPVRPSDIQRRE